MGVKHEIYSLDSSEGHKLYSQKWEPDQQIKALVCVVHGFAEHLDNYIEIIGLLNELGCIAFGHDHVGHGRSEGTRVHIKNWHNYVTDVLQHIDKIKEQHPNLPLFLLAHSMGGAIAIATATKKPEYFKGVVLIGPLIEVDPTTAGPVKYFSLSQLKIFGYLGKLFPYFPVQKPDYQYVSRCPNVRAFVMKDPLMHHGYAKAGWAAEMLDMILENQKCLEKIEWPFLLMHGDDDKICAVGGSKSLYEKACSKDKQLKIYDKAYHSPHREVEETKKEALQDIVTWIKQRI